jgi:hypothetical protein
VAYPLIADISALRASADVPRVACEHDTFDAVLIRCAMPCSPAKDPQDDDAEAPIAN